MSAVWRTAAGRAAAPIACLLALWGARAWQHARRFGSLKDLVAYSSRMIAAARAVESERTDALFVDPLASLLAGRKALCERQKRSARAARGTKQGSSDTRALSNIVCRTKFLDDLIVHLTGSGSDGKAMPDRVTERLQVTATQANLESPLISEASTSSTQHVQQVVMVGAGMDTRAWRLPSKRGITWFEVDQERVLTAKLEALRKAHVQTSHLSDDNTLRQHLTCWAYQTVGIDLAQDGLDEVLHAKGFDPLKPVLWVLEGLTYYLSEGENASLFRRLAALSAAGSVLVASMAPAAMVARSQQSQTGLMSTWKWGFLPEFAETVKAWGWNVADAIDYITIADLYGCQYASRNGFVPDSPPLVNGADPSGADSISNPFATSRVLLVTCTRSSPT